MLFHEKLIQRRKEQGMTQEDLAERLSVSRQTVSKWENGECMPDADKFIRLSDILEISLDELAGREVEVEPIVLPAPELPKPGGRLRRVLAAAAACLLIGLGCFALGRYVFPRAVPSESVQPAAILPETLTAEGLQFDQDEDRQGPAFSFVSNVTLDGTVYLYSDETGKSVQVAACYTDGRYLTGRVPVGRYSKAVFVVRGDGQERSVLLATEIDIDESGMSSWHPAGTN